MIISAIANAKIVSLFLQDRLSCFQFERKAPFVTSIVKMFFRDIPHFLIRYLLKKVFLFNVAHRF